jgi:lysozyme
MIPEEALRLVKHFEGLYLRAYLCPAGVPTIGWGSTGTDVRLGMVWTAEQCEERLIRDLAQCEKDALLYSPSLALDDRARSAVISFIYNLGAGAYRGSTLRKRINAGDMAGARQQIVRWNKAAGKVLNGLTRRRQAEAALL